MPLRRKKYGRRKAKIRPRRRRMVRRRKIYRQIQSGKRLGTTLVRQPTGLPDRIFVKLVSHVDLVFTNTAGAYSSFRIAINSAYDPYQSTGTQQGYLFDQWATLYGAYRVHGFKYLIMPSFGATGITSTSVAEITVVPSSQSSAFSSARLAAEQPRAKTVRWQVNSGRGPVLRGFVKPSVIFGVPRVNYTPNPNFYAAVGADPVSMCYLHIGTSDPVLTADRQTTAMMKFVQYVEFFDRKVPAVSD